MSETKLYKYRILLYGALIVGAIAFFSNAWAVIPKSVDKGYLLTLPDGSLMLCAHRPMDEDSIHGWFDMNCQPVDENKWLKCLADGNSGDTLCHDKTRRDGLEDILPEEEEKYEIGSRK